MYFCHLFYCSRGSKSVKKCSWCTRFCIDNDKIIRYLDRRFRFLADEFKYTGVEDIVSEVKATKSRLSLYYLLSDFTKPGNNRNENFGLIFFQSANKPVQLYFLYLEVFLKAFTSCFHENL